MKKIATIFLLSIVTMSVFAQETGNDTYTIQRLLVFNEKGKVLLEKHENGWMTPALRHNTIVSTNEGLKQLATSFGLEISTIQLAGNFMFLPEYKPQASYRQHYTSKKVSGELKIPEGKLDAQWFTPKKAIEYMSLPDTKLIFAIKDMTKQILENPETLWGGTFKLWKVENKTQYKLSEEFYAIRTN